MFKKEHRLSEGTPKIFLDLLEASYFKIIVCCAVFWTIRDKVQVVVPEPCMKKAQSLTPSSHALPPLCPLRPSCHACPAGLSHGTPLYLPAHWL